MTELGFTEEQEMFRQMVRDFARAELIADAEKRATAGRVPEELLKKMAGLGFIGLNVPQKYGGQPADWVMSGILVEELGRVDSLIAHTCCLPTVTALALENSSEELRQEWIPPLVRGEKIACLAMTEPEAGSDVTAIRTRAVRDGNFYVLDGEKTPVTCGRQAAVAIADAVTDPKAGPRGISCFLVPLDTPGINRSDMSYMSNSEGLASIVFEGARIPQKYLLGEAGKGLKIVLGELDVTRIWAALIALAMAQASLDDAINYAKMRVTFGKPIAKFQAISFKIAEAVTSISAARLLCYQALRLKDQGRSFAKESAMAKLFSTTVSASIIHDVLLMHGHYGFSTEHPIERRLRDAIGEELASGTHEMMKLTICREVMGDEFLPL